MIFELVSILFRIVSDKRSLFSCIERYMKGNRRMYLYYFSSFANTFCSIQGNFYRDIKLVDTVSKKQIHLYGSYEFLKNVYNSD